MDDIDRMIENFLAHHGIKGMHWGIRRDLHPNEGGGSGGSQKKIDREYEQLAIQIRSDMASKGVDSDRLKAKYGPPPSSGSPDGGGLTPGEKKALEVAGVAAGVAVVGAAGLAAYKLGLLQNPMLLEKTAINVYRGATDSAVNDLWHTGVDLPAGHIFSRVSTVAETSIREHGFFAAHQTADVERYKAILPVFWKQWGIGSPKAGGFVNNYEALVPIKAPTGEEATDIFRHLVLNNPEFRRMHGLQNFPDSRFHPALSPDATSRLRALFEAHSANWAGYEASPAAEIYFQEARRRGYNALVDYNDAGKLSKMPMRIIDSNAFKIHSNERLEYDEMRKAAKRVGRSLKAKHSYSEGGVMDVEGIIQNALAHHGVKGMHWGVRKDRYSGERSQASYLARVKTVHNVNRKIASGEGTLTNKLLTGSFTKGVAQKNADYQAQHIHRLETGNAKVTDLIQKYAALSVSDIHAGFSQKKLDKNLTRAQKLSDKQLGLGHSAMEAGAEFLEHHGVKGMHWGIRKDRASRVTVVTDPTKKRKKIQTTGGHDLPAHGDAIKARTNQQRLSKSGTDALSNRQLQDLQTRLNLEQNVSRLHKQQREAAKPWIIRFLKDPRGRKQLSDAATSPAAKAGATYVKKSFVKKAATAAAVAAI